MASIDTGGGGGGKKGAPKRINTRVDFTPMVDMNMLLLTFFMFCTTLSKPQIMNIVMPMPDDKINEENKKPDTKDSQAMTIILGENNKVYYYTGLPDYNDYTSLKETTYPDATNNGFRGVLMERNAKIMGEIRELNKEKAENARMTDEEFKKKANDIKKDKDGQVVVIIPTEGATFKNLVDAMDEMAICSVGRYAVVDIREGERFMLENYKTKGAYGQSATAPK